MKFVILHGTGGTHESNWFPWLKKELEKLGHEVWVPDLPDADAPKIKTWNEYLLKSGNDFSESVLIGHSAGAVEINGILQELPEDTKAKAAIYVGVFRGDLNWETLRGMNIEFDFEKIKGKAGKFIVVHSDNNPHCPLDGAKWIAGQLNADFFLFPNKGHFSASTQPPTTEVPEILGIIKQKVL